MRDEDSWQEWSDDRAELVRMIGETGSFTGEPAVPPGVVLERGERLFLHTSGVSLVEIRHAAGHSAGASTGFSFRVAKGVSWRVGGSRGRHLPGPESLTAMDAGAAFITDRRVVFTGSRQAREWSFAKLLGVRHEETSPVTWLPVSNRQRVSGLAYAGEDTVLWRFRLVLALGRRGRRPERPQVGAGRHARGARRRPAAWRPLPLLLPGRSSRPQSRRRDCAELCVCSRSSTPASPATPPHYERDRARWPVCSPSAWWPDCPAPRMTLRRSRPTIGRLRPQRCPRLRRLHPRTRPSWPLRCR